MKSGNLNFLETCGPLRACDGTDLTFYYINYIFLVEYFFTMLNMHLDTNC